MGQIKKLESVLCCSGNAIQAFGNGTDVGVWQPQPPLRSTTAQPGTSQRGKEPSGHGLDTLTNTNTLEADTLYSFCGSLQVSLQNTVVTGQDYRLQ